MSLRAKLGTFVGSLLLMILLFAGGTLYWSEKNALLRKLEDSHQSLSVSFGQSCGDALVVSDQLAAINAVQVVARSPSVVEAACVDSSGRIIAHSDDGLRGAAYRTPSSARVIGSDSMSEKRRWWDPTRGWMFGLTRFSPVGPDGAGRAVIVWSEKEIHRTVQRALGEAARRIVVVFIGAFSIGLAGVFLLARSLTRPLQDLATTANRVGQGDFTVRVAPGGGLELEELGRVFNQTAAALSQLDQMKDEFISMVSHDLRSPLNAIQSYAETLREERRGALNEKQKQYLTTIVESARSLAFFVNDVLDLAKVRAGRMEYHPEEVVVSAAVGNVVTLLQDVAERQGIRLDSAVTDALRVRADPHKVERILTNLVSNALKVVPRQTGTVKVSARKEGDHARVEVADNGPGLTPEDRSRLFQKFVQLTAGVSNARMRTVGTGLGLTLVKLMVEAQGGGVGVESDVGRGSVFFFTLPLLG